MRALRSIGLVAAVGCLASACSLVADGSDFQGNGDGTGPQQLFDVQDRRIEEWCACFSAIWNFGTADQCEAALKPNDAFRECVSDAFAMEPEMARSFMSCQIEAHEDALMCEQSAGCTFGGFNQCFNDLTFALNDLSCIPSDTYFEQVALCAEDHVVGDPMNDCQSGDLPAIQGSTVVGHTVDAGSDWDLVDSECFPRDAAGQIANRGAADQAFEWTAQTDGPLLIDTFGSRFDSVLYLVDGSNCSTTQSQACNDDAETPGGDPLGPLQSLIRTNVATGDTLTVVLDGFSEADFGQARVNFTALGCADVENFLPVSRDTGDAVFMKDFDLINPPDDDFDVQTDGCPNAPDAAESQPDIVLPWQAPAAGTYTIDTSGSVHADSTDTPVDTLLYTRRSCDRDQDAEGNPFSFEDACNDDADDSTPTSRIEVSLMAGETILIVVDILSTTVDVGTVTVNIN